MGKDEYLEKYAKLSRGILNKVVYNDSVKTVIDGNINVLSWSKENNKCIRGTFWENNNHITVNEDMINDDRKSENKELIEVLLHEYIHSYVYNNKELSKLVGAYKDESPIFQTIVTWFNIQFEKNNLDYYIKSNVKGGINLYEQYKEFHKDELYLLARNIDDFDEVITNLVEWVEEVRKRMVEWSSRSTESGINSLVGIRPINEERGLYSEYTIEESANGIKKRYIFIINMAIYITINNFDFILEYCTNINDKVNVINKSI